MKIYLSIAKDYSFARVSTVMAALEPHQIIRYNGGKYSIQPVIDSDVCLTLIRPGQDTLGRGQYDELNGAALAGNICRCVEVKDNDTFIVYEVDDSQKVGGDWKHNYASLSTTNPEKVERNDLYQHLKDIM
jgi:hypothetical protein